MKHIDGSVGEGGGQVLRTSLSLSAITGQPFCIKNIRSNRKKPGLMRQHLTCAKAVTEICGGELHGAELGSSVLEFRPGKICGGDYRFAIGTAGNTLLLAQAILPVLLFADVPSRVILEGGTHTTSAPTYDFFERVYLPCLRKMGIEADCRLDRWGFYPVGGGMITLSVKPVRAWNQFALTQRGELQEARITAIGSGLDRAILEDELRFFRTGLAEIMPFEEMILEVDSRGPGNVLFAETAFSEVTELFSFCGSFGTSRKNVADHVAKMTRQYLRSPWVAGKFLADQLMLPLALGKGGTYRTGELSMHSKTNKVIIGQFLDYEIDIVEIDKDLCEVTVHGNQTI